MIGDLDNRHFDTLELITILGGVVTRDEFAMRAGITPDSATTRLQRLKRHGLLEASQDPDSTGSRKRGLYRLSSEGERRFLAALAAMDAEPEPEPEPVQIPAPSWLIEIPALIAARVITMEAA